MTISAAGLQDTAALRLASTDGLAPFIFQSGWKREMKKNGPRHRGRLKSILVSSSELERIFDAMHYLTFFRLSLALPLVVPLPFVYLIYAIPENAVPAALLVLAGIFTFSLFYGGIPYVAFAIYGAWWLKNRSVAEIRRMMKIAPLRFCLWYFSIILAFSFVVMLFSRRSEALAGGLLFGVIGLPFILALGYFYVFIVTFIYERMNITETTPAPMAQ